MLARRLAAVTTGRTKIVDPLGPRKMRRAGLLRDIFLNEGLTGSARPTATRIQATVEAAISVTGGTSGSACTGNKPIACNSLNEPPSSTMVR